MKTILIALAGLAFASCAKDKAPPPHEGSDMTTPAVVAPADAAPPPIDAEPPAPIPPYTPSASVSDPIKAAIAASDRTDNDRRLDAGRKPGEVLSFFGIAPGQKIGELFAGGGYTTELMARTVGDSGHVWAENTKEIMDKLARKPWTVRAASPAMKNVTSVELPIDAPFPPDAKDLDAVIMVLNYHDTVNMKDVDRGKMNKAVLAALKKGGVFGIVDSSAVAGSGTRDTDTLHRIDEEFVKKEVTAAGFKLVGERDVLRNPDDKRDWNSSPRAAGPKRGTMDQFVLKFAKP